ncbi:NitT/TauT family transport system permease protein [Marinitoga hydrogenitolerans DSM 16785]|uniref:NitT/TauT family transport system permease protein n=1 Tax=Marinitoga hydrogenitolerans (strain DSM 16785 / JCM 12826 / AT1271) TaxID=1122195 RepID=A0A1M4URX9_MARH1|nr:ATP-binding cassette domain-containing protein [Marinitoga hydrogenitolerans]SHE59397.1 NitT/TauT family transport system permease protein [Marinitoga hydrogenitolerans DSM 16785]
MKKNTILGLLLIIFTWWIIAFFTNNQLLIPFPQNVFKEMGKLFLDYSFYTDLLNTVSKIIIGFFISLLIGIPIGFISGLSQRFFEIFRPFLMIIQSSPVVSYIAISMLWFGIGFYTPIFVAFMVIFPVIVLNISEGIKSTDKKLLEMAKVYNIRKKDIFLKIYFPSIIPFLKSTLNMISGSLWKSIVVGEFLAGDKGLGVSLSFSKIALNTDRVFAYTILLAIFGMLSEKFLKKLSKNKKKKKEIKNIKVVHINKNNNKNLHDIIIKGLNKKFGNDVILSGFDIIFKKSKINVLLGESGIGKTTILNILSGILKKESGEIIVEGKIGYVFQDDRLIPWLNVYENIVFVNDEINLEIIEKYLKSFNLEKEILSKYPDELSGGMKKRINLLRAIAYNPDIILMDEAFSSIDVSNKYKIIKELINIQKEEKFTVIMVTHDPFEVANFGENVFILEGKPLKIKKIMNFKRVFERNLEDNHEILYKINKILLG